MIRIWRYFVGLVNHFFINKKSEPFGSPSLVNKYNYLETANLTHS